MTDPESSAADAFFRVFGGLPRQGPGSRECTAQALGMCTDLPLAPDVVDLGCGSGAQTLDLAELTRGALIAVDSHAPFLDQLVERAAARGLTSQLRTLVADMRETGLPAQSADLVWSEGALYNLGLKSALPLCRRLLRPGGYLAFTDAVWRKADVPASVREAFADYPTMGSVSDVLATVRAQGFQVVGHFTLPEEAWWQDFYTPMRARLGELRASGSVADTAVLEACDAEIVMFGEHSDCYAYEFVVARSGLP